ncbi:MAG: RNA methyltransferase [Polyangiales bacterium]
MTSLSSEPTEWLAERESLRAARGAGPRLLLDGSRLVEAAQTAGLVIERLWLCPPLYSDPTRTLALLGALPRVPKLTLDVRAFSRVSYKADGVVAVVVYATPSLDDVLAAPPIRHADAGLRAADLVLVLDGLSDPGNVGAVARTANAWGARGLIAVDGLARLRHPKGIRASMGAIFHTPCASASRVEVARRLEGRPVLALTAPPPGMPSRTGLPDEAWDAEELVVVLGNERRGVHPQLLRVATWTATIPMLGFVDSLNVSNAAAVVLWERARRRGAS